MISRNLFRAYIEGLGAGENPIFPNLCYRLQDGINLHPGEPNFDLTELAIECVGKRIQPRFVFCDSPAYPSKWDAGAMGCVDGQEVVSYTYDNEFYCEAIERLWDKAHVEVQQDGVSKFKKPVGLNIWDGSAYVNVKTIIKNPDNHDWTRVTFSDGRSILVTSDHPLYTTRGRIPVSNLIIGDMVKSYYDFPAIDPHFKTIGISEELEDYEAYTLGVLIADGCYASRHVSATFDTATEQDIIAKFSECAKRTFNTEISVHRYERGAKGNYDMVSIKTDVAKWCDILLFMFGGEQKIHRSIPNIVFTANRKARVAFMAGLIDADGYVSRQNKVQIGSTNKELSLQQLALAQSLGLPAKMYLNKYVGPDCDKIRYRVEFSMTQELADQMASKKKKEQQWSGKESMTKVPSFVKVTKIEFLGCLNMPSYDVETESDKFTLSFIESGNCRTSIRSNVNGDQSPDARGNLAFSTINLPMLAIEATKKAEKTGNQKEVEFISILRLAIDDTIDELLERYKLMCTFKVKDLPFISDWYQGHEGLGPNNSIEPMIKNGTLGIGFVGLAETLYCLFGSTHAESAHCQEFGLDIVGMIKQKAESATKNYHLNFSCFASPAESASHTLLKLTRKRFGIIPGVTEREYFTNSFHVPVWIEVDAKTKIDIEAPYHLLCSGGAIMYVELGESPKDNPEGALAILQYMAKSGAVYGGLNWEHDYCCDCGYQGTFDGVCPKCGSDRIKVTKIITGYLSETYRFNKGKKAEAADRVSHTGGALSASKEKRD